ncbi:MAG: alkaline phosphatase D family protein [Dehalococcoidia bacterium]
MRQTSGSLRGRRSLPFIALASIALLLAAACDSDDTPPPYTGATATFSDGIASGDVTATTAVVWTRAEGADLLTVEVATDASFGAASLSQRAETSADRDFTVEATVEGLTPDTRYYYRFRAGDTLSPQGAFTTAPADAASRVVRFVFSGDSDGRRNPDGTPVFNEFEVLDTAAAEQPDFFLYFGDTIYGDRDPEATTLPEYRAKYRQNRTYRALRDILAAAPIVTVWDDHEVVNDFAGTTVDPARLAAGRRAFGEYWPIGEGSGNTLYRSFPYGRDLELIVLDERTYRDASVIGACVIDEAADPIPAAGDPAAPENVRGLRQFVGLPPDAPPGCLEALSDPARTMLGAEQEQWLKDTLRASGATWKVVVNAVPVQMLLALPYDRWEGYAAERRELLEFLRDEDIRNVLFVTTDFHANIFGPVLVDNFSDPQQAAYEAVAGPIATTPLQRDIEDEVGRGAAGALAALLESVVGVDCAVLDAYAYGLAEIDPAAGTLTLTAKDQANNELCRTVLTAQ